MSVAVWMPCYNEIKHLKGAIESVLAQSYRDFTLYISDNYSTDGSFETACGYAKLDARVVVLRPKEFLAGIPHMKACWEMLDTLHQDYSIHIGGHDLWQPRHLEILVNRMDQEVERRAGNKHTIPPALCYSYTYQIDEEDKVVGAYQDIMQIGQIPRIMIPHFAIVGLNSPHLYGLWWEPVRRRCPVRYSCGGWDHLVVAEAATHGAILFDGNTQLLLRGPAPPTGQGLEYYGNKHFSPERLAAGYQDYLDQLEWYRYIILGALDEVPQEAQELYRAMIVSSMVGIYLALRGQNLTAVRGAWDKFFEHPDVKAIIGGAIHIERHLNSLLSQGVKIDD